MGERYSVTLAVDYPDIVGYAFVLVTDVSPPFRLGP